MIWIGLLQMNQEDQLFEDSEYLCIIQSFNIKLERVTIRGYRRLYSSEEMDVRLGRSIINSFISILLFIFNEQSSLPARANEPSLMEFNCGRSIIHSNHSNT